MTSATGYIYQEQELITPILQAITPKPAKKRNKRRVKDFSPATQLPSRANVTPNCPTVDQVPSVPDTLVPRTFTPLVPRRVADNTPSRAGMGKERSKGEDMRHGEGSKDRSSGGEEKEEQPGDVSSFLLGLQDLLSDSDITSQSGTSSLRHCILLCTLHPRIVYDRVNAWRKKT